MTTGSGAVRMLLKNAALTVGAALARNFYRPPAGVLFPCGHIAADVAPPHVRHLYAVPGIAKFDADLDFLGRHYRPLAASELERLPMRDRKLPQSFLLSFDDGMREIYDVIAPMLRRKGIPAMFFVNTAMLDNKQLMWRHKVSLVIERSRQRPGRVPPHLKVRAGQSWHEALKALPYKDEGRLDEIAAFLEVDFDDYLRTARPYLTTDQVADLARAGFEIGSHSATHPYLQELTEEDQKRQIGTSLTYLRNLGLACRYFAFPFHDEGISPALFRYLRDLGILLSFGTSEARVDSITFSLQRFYLDADRSNAIVKDILGEMSAKALIRRLSRTEVIRRH